ncbi:MAG TPA: histidine--tRNA ligase [Phycisphaerae bacterium]|nr:histidine--tRNA ligase [Phycisphaerae bacterium]
MKIQGVKGTRDLYPELLAPIRHIFDVWRRVSIRHGFEEYEGPTLEYLDLYREKSGEELVGQLYRLTDSGGRELALRPEMTPTLARMVAAKVSALPKPIKWFSIPTLFRGENVQRGRLREFYQWNIDVIGTADPLADAECILVGVEALRELGLTAADFAVHISNRRLMSALLAAGGIAPDRHDQAFALMDKAGKLDAAEFARRWDGAFATNLSAAALSELMAAKGLAELESVAVRLGERTAALDEAVAETGRLMTILDNFGITEFCKIDLRVVRGLAYYTGPVFEFYDRSEKERAICGGGRYDDLLGKLGKSKEPAVGFGMGDVVLSLILEEKGLLGAVRRGGLAFVADAIDGMRPHVYRIVADLRRGGVTTEFSYAPQAFGKQMKLADKLGAQFVVIVGEDTRVRQVVKIKNMAGGGEREVSLKELCAEPIRFLGPAK